MPLHTTRRRFLQQTTALAAAATGGWASRAAAIEPIERNGQPKFKFSLAAYSYRSLLSGSKPKLTLHDFIADCAAMGLEGSELTSYYFPQSPSGEYLRQLRHAAFRLGLDVSGTAVRNDFCFPAGKQRDQQIEHVKTWVQHAAAMGAPVIRIFAGNVKAGQDEAAAIAQCIEGIEAACQHAGEHGVILALENHGGITSTPESMLKIVEGVRSPWFGVNVDTGNFHTSDVYGDLAKIAPYAVNVQVKVVISPAGGGKQPTDYRRLANILRDADYRGYIVLEYEEKGDPRTQCPKHVEQMREGFLG